jgi:hypothetical protein
MHFRASDGVWIDVEIWGDMDFISNGRYSQTRALKEAWQAQNPHFLGIEHRDCFSDARLSEILRRYIGVIEPFNFERPYDPIIQTAHWTDADELLETCAALAAQMPDGKFPSEDWLRKRGKYANREGESYRTLAHRVNQWGGGTRNVRRILGHAEASTTKWSAELAVAKWREFTQLHGLTPSQCHSSVRRQQLPRKVIEEASGIYAAATRHGVLELAREGHTARAKKWTPEAVAAEWRAFVSEHGADPTHFMSAGKRARFPKEVTDRATRVYEAARRTGSLETLRAEGGKQEAGVSAPIYPTAKRICNQ